MSQSSGEIAPPCRQPRVAFSWTDLLIIVSGVKRLFPCSIAFELTAEPRLYALQNDWDLSMALKEKFPTASSMSRSATMELELLVFSSSSFDWIDQFVKGQFRRSPTKEGTRGHDLVSQISVYQSFQCFEKEDWLNGMLSQTYSPIYPVSGWIWFWCSSMV